MGGSGNNARKRGDGSSPRSARVRAGGSRSSSGSSSTTKKGAATGGLRGLDLEKLGGSY